MKRDESNWADFTLVRAIGLLSLHLHTARTGFAPLYVKKQKQKKKRPNRSGCHKCKGPYRSSKSRMGGRRFPEPSAGMLALTAFFCLMPVSVCSDIRGKSIPLSIRNVPAHEATRPVKYSLYIGYWVKGLLVGVGPPTFTTLLSFLYSWSGNVLLT